MRIVSGVWRGREIVAPKGRGVTRPTTDRTRESIISQVASYFALDLSEVQVLDAFAGSGALGFELLSRGCAHVIFVDKDTAALSCIKKTAASLGVERARHEIVRADSFEYAARMRADGQIRCVLLDPPYAFEASKIAELVSLLDARGVLAQDACIMYEHDVKSAELTVSGWQTYKTKRFGISAIQLLERAACES